MDKRLQSIMQKMDLMKLGLDDTFHFGCRQCGKCCINREDILLNAKDMYNLCKALNLTAEQVVQQYCEVYIGHDSRMPIVRLKPRGSIIRCPLLKDRKCSVHSLKPTVCAMFPIGRCLELNQKEVADKDLRKSQIVFFHNQADCGDKKEMHTVREWLAMFGIPIEDESFYIWHQTIIGVSDFVHKVEDKLPENVMLQIWSNIFMVLYLHIDPKEEFLPQLRSNSQGLLAALNALDLSTI